MRSPAVFLDRDGTITEEVVHLCRIDQLRLLPGAAEAVALLKREGFKVVVVTNQSAVARGYLTEEALHRIHGVMESMLFTHGALLDAIYYCPHHPTEGAWPYCKRCGCRKPEPGMLRQAAGELKIDLGRSFAVGDKVSDLEAGHLAGCRTVLVRTGYGRDADASFRRHHFQPNHVAESVLDASRWIVNESVRRELDPHACQV
jgi:D-glycero-D-manno-heptose 1,7-bisphosphate phosphatase